MATKAGVAGALGGSRPPVPKLACFLPEGSPTHWTLLIRNHRLLVRGNSGTNVLFVAIVGGRVKTIACEVGVAVNGWHPASRHMRTGALTVRNAKG